jgi:TonB family protein
MLGLKHGLNELADHDPEWAGRLVDGVLLATKDDGWVRTARSKFGTFVLRFEARRSRPDARVLFAMFGVSPNKQAPGNAYTVQLFGGPLPAPRAVERMRLMVFKPEVGVLENTLRSQEREWQPYEITRRRDSLEMVVNGQRFVAQDSPRTADGWLGFLADGGDVEIRNLRVGPAPSEPPPRVFDLGPGLTPPRLVHEQRPAYTRAALTERLEGDVVLECAVEIDGRIQKCLVVRSLDQRLGLDEQAIIAARQWRFRPATRSGQPVPVLVTIGLAFTIKN